MANKKKPNINFQKYGISDGFPMDYPFPIEFLRASRNFACTKGSMGFTVASASRNWVQPGLPRFPDIEIN
jgi:hypothetical protein